MIQQILKTEVNYICFFLRVVAGVIIFPYGMQKLLGWFNDFGGGVGIKASLAQLKKKKVPLFLAWMVILGQSLGSIALITGFAGRIAAVGNFIIFTGALINHLPDGWVLNWTGRKRGEGIEYFVLLLSMLLIIIINGSGAVSIDLYLQKSYK
ncbi:DoxX family protein [Lacibacter sediminis]|uniref:DoxX family protein n=1 Tax=Lacibacter sediminis TaxID=2760713 RepID=A0A7G5XKA6_9BACT|nr:DoxX family protein [Lacibacter sediminis]QNA45909.1 DoxX family protein [Lacibacter sediminis]